MNPKIIIGELEASHSEIGWFLSIVGPNGREFEWVDISMAVVGRRLIGFVLSGARKSERGRAHERTPCKISVFSILYNARYFLFANCGKGRIRESTAEENNGDKTKVIEQGKGETK
jgi:hypothetical protein